MSLPNFIKHALTPAIVATLLNAGGIALAAGDHAAESVGQLHPATQIGLPDAKVGHAHGIGDAHEEDGAHATGDGHNDTHGGHGEADMSANFEARLDPAGPYVPRTPMTLRITIHEKAAGKQIRSFDITHEKRLHLIIVSSDLEEFYHEHPDLQPDGTFVLENFALPRELLYTLYFDLKPTGTSGILLKKEIAIGRGETLSPFLKPSQFPVVASGIRLDFKSSPATLRSGEEAQLTFRLFDAQGSLLNDIQAYLGAAAHLVMISEASLDYLHVHPLGDFPEDPVVLHGMRFGPDIKFAATFPKAGSHKGWLQIQRDDASLILPFVVDVAAGEHIMADGSAMAGDHHESAQAGLTREAVAQLVHETQKTEEGRSVVKFIALTVFVFGMMLLFYPKRPVVTAQPAQQPAASPPPQASSTPTPPSMSGK